MFVPASNVISFAETTMFPFSKYTSPNDFVEVTCYLECLPLKVDVPSYLFHNNLFYRFYFTEISRSF